MHVEDRNMRSKLVLAALLATALLPSSAVLAQEQPTDRLPTDQQMVAPEDQPASVGACGSDAAAITNRTPNALAPVGTDQAKDIVGEAQVNLMSVRGTIVHTEGNLLLVKQLETPSMTPAPGGQAPNLLAVVRVPAECAPGMLTEGEGVMAVGTSTADGILNAQSIQPAD